MIDITGLREDKRPQSSTIVHALLDRLEAAEKERDALRINLDDHRALVFVLRKEVEKHRAKIEEMEKQGPVAWMLEYQTLGGNTGWILSWTRSGVGVCKRLQGEAHEKRLYALPGAQGEEK